MVCPLTLWFIRSNISVEVFHDFRQSVPHDNPGKISTDCIAVVREEPQHYRYQHNRVELNKDIETQVAIPTAGPEEQFHNEYIFVVYAYSS